MIKKVITHYVSMISEKYHCNANSIRNYICINYFTF